MAATSSFELGVYSFGNTPEVAGASGSPTAQAIRNALEAVRLAEEVGLDFFGLGEHHTPSMPLSAPTSLVNAAAASTSRIKLGTAVSVLSTDDPIRIYQQMATAAAICIAVGNVSLDDCPMFTWSLGCTGSRDPIFFPDARLARLEITSLTFILVLVPEPV